MLREQINFDFKNGFGIYSPQLDFQSAVIKIPTRSGVMIPHIVADIRRDVDAYVDNYEICVLLWEELFHEWDSLIPRMKFYALLDWLATTWEHLGEAESNFESVSLSLSDSYPLIIALCTARLSSDYRLIRRKSLATVLFEEATRNRKLYKASQEPGIFAPGFNFNFYSLKFCFHLSEHSKSMTGPFGSPKTSLHRRPRSRSGAPLLCTTSQTLLLFTLLQPLYAPTPTPF